MLQGAQIGNIHTLKDLGLYLKVGGKVIGLPEPQKLLQEVRGSDIILDLTRSVDGEVHYYVRHQKTVGTPSKAHSQMQSMGSGSGACLMMTAHGIGRVSGK